MRYITLFLTAVLFASTAFAGGIKFEDGNWQATLDKAKKEKKLVFLDAYTTWCGPCKWMSKNVFTDDAVGAYYNSNFVNAKMDMEKGEGLDIAEKYGINVYPSLLWINGDGEVVHRVCGAIESEVFIKAGKTALDNKANLRYYTNKGTKKASAEYIYEYLTVMNEACLNTDEVIGAYMDSMPAYELTSEGNWKIITDFGLPYTSEAFSFLVCSQKEFDAKYGKETVDTIVKEMFLWELQKSLRGFSKNPDPYYAFIAKLDDFKYQYRDQIMDLGSLNVSYLNEDWYGIHKMASYMQDKTNFVNADMWNKLAWAFYTDVEDEAMLQTAVTWTDLALQEGPKSYILDTKAALYIKLGNKEEALNAAREALKVAQEEGRDLQVYEDRLKEAESMN